MIGDPVILGIVLFGLVVAILLLIWDYRSERSREAAMRRIEASIRENSEAITGMLTETQLLIERLEKTLGKKLGEIERAKGSAGSLSDESMNDSKHSKDEQPSPTAVTVSIPSLDAEKAKVLFTNLRRNIPVGEEGISQLRMNLAGPAPNSSPTNPLHQFKPVTQVGDFIAFSADAEQTFLFPNPEVGQSATAFGQVFPELKEGDFFQALEMLIPLRIKPHDDGSWASI